MERCVKFDEFLKLLEEYKAEYGHCNVPQRHKTASGIPLGSIVNTIRSGARSTTPEQKAKLDAIGFVWDACRTVPFEEVLRLLEEFKEKYGHCDVPKTHKTASGIPLGEIVRSIRKGDRKITDEQKAKLQSIGFRWKLRKMTSFEEVLGLLEDYKAEYGHCNVPHNHKTASGIPLGEIMSCIRHGKRNTTPEQKAKLDAIGFVWRVRDM